jgi:integrase
VINYPLGGTYWSIRLHESLILLAILTAPAIFWQHLATPKHTHFVAKELPKRGMDIMVRRSLTDRKVNSLKRDKGLEDKLGHFDTWDTDVHGLGVRTSKTGRRTFVLAARYPGSSNPTRRALGKYPEMTLAEARAKAKEWKELIGRGIDPEAHKEAARQAELRKRANTFAAVAEDYVLLQVIGPDPAHPRQRKAGEVSRDFRRVFAALWGERPITSITRHDVLALIEGVRDNGTAATLAAYGKGPKADKAPAREQARNQLSRLKTFFAWAIERGAYGLESSPCEFIKGSRILGEKRSTDRTLNDAELRAFWQATGDMAYPYGPLYRLLCLTGLRLNEVADAVWSEFDLAKGIWTIPATRMKGKNGKARPHSVPLTADILAILGSLPRFNGGEFLFSNTNGERGAWVAQRVKRRLDAAMAEKLGNLPAWVNHDLRRTLRSRLSEMRVSPDVAEAILAHVKPGIRGVYDRYEYFDEKKHALELWATRLRSIVQPQPNLVELAQVRK